MSSFWNRHQEGIKLAKKVKEIFPKTRTVFVLTARNFKVERSNAIEAVENIGNFSLLIY